MTDSKLSLCSFPLVLRYPKRVQKPLSPAPRVRSVLPSYLSLSPLTHRSLLFTQTHVQAHTRTHTRAQTGGHPWSLVASSFWSWRDERAASSCRRMSPHSHEEHRSCSGFTVRNGSSSRLSTDHHLPPQSSPRGPRVACNTGGGFWGSYWQ